MATLFLMLIYLTFISLGLPDSLLGSAWPAIHTSLGAQLSSAGIISMCISGGTIVSSLSSERVIRRFGTGRVTAVSVLLTASALLGFTFAPSFWFLVLLAIPLGLGGGAVDAALNNFVALHYSARHMSWLHCFWGVGAFVSPLTMAAFLGRGDWRGGYFTVSMVQFGVSALLIISLPLWNRQSKTPVAAKSAEPLGAPRSTRSVLKISGVAMALLTFLLYCAIESTTGLWSSSYLVGMRGFSVPQAARAASLFFGSITVGRLVTGFFANRFSERALIRVGAILVLAGSVCIAAPLPSAFTIVSLVLMGIGCAPIYPSMIHATPGRFGADVSQKVIGLQMATAYTGSTFVPPIVGFFVGSVGMFVVPAALVVLSLGMLFFSERLSRQTGKKAA